MVEDPKDYRCCGYASALAGNALARQGLLSCKLGANWDAGAAAYRMRLFGRGGSALRAYFAVSHGLNRQTTKRLYAANAIPKQLSKNQPIWNST